ncbi:putative disease resistance protein At3g14460 isoform X1 [Quercus robur]|uniref:putative disease resistance protein At3g14460 isoform X1 n=1 Tax=Quercus robur TaxID=38942 RepID=UPI002162BC9F|nr:putative disease resistance protein At3g14460 isoform X1 [Quercus robur]XP_050272958.1 putative disease resistance protein At3g14460 isoform X1 [Quercus robur]XP_050272968.1 putative disease resistance protein At3g14460 isoform X1 [Quercus robur]XP_050272977.1 putative disease resistance protein At3g14460 isoform X1 [Quercus robur]XP_050272986.1 putative disease resistance protein At3g14460 isoform X1 [Quercus robur]XP_050272995.1 putative disease resistance protein At3g14460 isoform X1 [Qu
MAATLVGGAFLSATLQVLFDRMASQEVVKFIRGRKVPATLLTKLKTWCLTLNKVLNDAEEKEITDTNVKEWVDELKDAVYHAEDLLDEIATEALRCQVEADFVTRTSKVRNFISTSFDQFGRKLESKIQEVVDKLENLDSQINAIGLREGVEGRSSQRVPTTSLVDPETIIYGRDDDEKAIVNLLLSNDVASNNHSTGVIPIVGMGGVGKTTLARQIYNNQKIIEHFSLKAWVCVSEEFDVPKITKKILESVSPQKHDHTDFNKIQTELKNYLMGKKCLLILDDVWNENYDDWALLSIPFKYGTSGSRIIVTTRNRSVALIMRPIQIFNLNKLSEEDCWLLFANHAFENGKSNAYPELERIGEEIIKKCDGLPLAAKALGCLLHSKLDVEEWNKILKSEIWSLPNDGGNVLPALRLSYNYLPSHLKRCFAYCSIFPKNYLFKMEELVQLWMGEGFLQQHNKNEEMEDIGAEYFLDLVSRSLLQRSNGNKLCFLMHDLVHDLAKSVSGKFCFRSEGDNTNKIIEKTRHFSYLRTTYDIPEKFTALCKAKNLRTFIALEMKKEDKDEDNKVLKFYLTKKVQHDLLLTLRFLRVLSLSHYCNIELPELIGDFKHLRYLDVSFTGIEKLPKSTCMLPNLQTLNLSGCKFLVKLPRNMRNLINLRHLYISGTSIKNMPIHMGRLQCLQTLTKFVVGKDIGFRIEELGKLSNLRGVIVISNLQNVINSTNALEAKLKDKEHLKELTLEWDAANDVISRSERDVLNNLQPHTSLTMLVIKNYNDTSFPNWVGDSSFSNITVVHLNSCRNCSSLPSLGQLPSLLDLFVFGFDEVVTVDANFYGSGSYTATPFQSLKILRFKAMSKWEEWSPYHKEGKDEEAFPSLQELYLEECPKLSGSLPKHLPSLTELGIEECEQLETSLPTAPFIRKLVVRNCNVELLKKLPPTLHDLTIIGFENLESLPEGVMDHNHSVEKLFISEFPVLKSLPRGGLSSPTTLKYLFIRNCKELEFPMYPCYSSLVGLIIEYSCNPLKSFPLDIFPKLRYLVIEGCRNMESLSVSEGHHLTDLLRLKIKNCPHFVAFPSGGLSVPNLSELEVSNCSLLNSLPENMHAFLPSLQFLDIINCPQIESFPKGGLPSNLISLRISDCKKLICNRMEWGLQRLQSLKRLAFINYDRGCWDVESFPEEYLLPTTVTHLYITGFGNLRTLDNNGFQHLNSLQYLSLEDCPKLKHMPEEGLPVTISNVKIITCPLLTKRLQRKKGKEWSNIAHTPFIEIIERNQLSIDGESRRTFLS